MASFFTIFMPCALVVLSLWRIAALRSRRNGRSVSDIIWVCAYALVNALACVWSASVLSQRGADGQLPADLVAASSRVGVGMFIAFLLVLAARDIGAGLASALYWLGTRIAAAWRRAP